MINPSLWYASISVFNCFHSFKHLSIQLVNKKPKIVSWTTNIVYLANFFLEMLFDNILYIVYISSNSANYMLNYTNF